MHWPQGAENPEEVASINGKELEETDTMKLYHSIWSEENTCIHQYVELFMRWMAKLEVSHMAIEYNIQRHVETVEACRYVEYTIEFFYGKSVMI